MGRLLSIEPIAYCMSASPPRILAIEDTLVHTRIVKRCLADTYDLAVVASVEEARGQLEREAFDLLLVDWGLPGESGLSFVQDLRGRGREADPVPAIVMLTAEDRQDHVVDAINAGVDDYIVKPLQCQVLRDKVAALV